MTRTLALLGKELFCFWASSLAWIVLSLFLLVQGISFFLVLDYTTSFEVPGTNGGPVTAYFSSLFVPSTLVLLCPSLSMASVAGERQNGTLDTLLTAPIGPAAVVVAKYLALMVNYTLLWLPTGLYLPIARNLTPIDWGVVLGGYLGVLLVGAAALALGLLMSTLASTQLAAFILSAGVLFSMLVLGVGEQVFEPGLLRELCAHLSIQGQFVELARGVVDSRRIVLDISVVAVCLLLAKRRLDAWAWAG